MWPAFETAADAIPASWDLLRHDAGTLELGEFLDVRLDAGRSTVGLIISGGGTFVRVITAHRVAWTVTGEDLRGFGRRHNREVETFTCTSTPEGLLRLDLGLRREVDCRLGLVRDIDISITAAEFASYELQVDGLPDASPDYTELDDAAIHHRRPDWNSDCRVLGWSRRTA